MVYKSDMNIDGDRAVVRKYSFTMINTYEICPWKFRWNYVLYNKEPATPEMDEGNRVHKDFEDMFAERKPPTSFVQPYIDALRPIRDNQCSYTEKQLGMRGDGTKTGYAAKDVFYRAKLDLLVIPPVSKGDTAYNIDWKTGNPNYPKMNQLIWSDLLIFANYPWIDRVGSRLIFIGAKGKRIFPEDGWNVTRRADVPDIMQELKRAAGAIAQADKLELYPKKESALCAYCAVKDCEHHGR